MTDQARRLRPEELTFVCDPAQFQFETTDDLPDLTAIIGQERAVRAIDFGVQIRSHGFNVFAMGPSGTGKSTTVQMFLERRAQQEAAPDDWCYVNNFRDPRRPRVLRLPAGWGNRIRDDMAELIRDLRNSIPTAFDSDDFAQRSGAIVRQMENDRDQILQELEGKAKQHKFTLIQTAMGLGVAPLLDQQPVTPEQYEQLPDDVKNEFETEHQGLQEELDRAMREIRALEKRTKDQMQTLVRDLAGFLSRDHIDDLKEIYNGFPDVVEYLEQVHHDIIERIDRFQADSSVQLSSSAQSDGQTPDSSSRIPLEPFPDFSGYQVNVIIDHDPTEGAPVVFETKPSYSNLVGRVEQEARFGVLTTNFTHIQPGALHRANGGYLVIQARDLLEHTLAWDALERTIKNREIRTDVPEQLTAASGAMSLEPESIPFAAKVILIGDWSSYSFLYNLDEDFRKVFKVRADFGSTMERTPEAIQRYAEFVALRVKNDGLLPFAPSAVARIVEEGVRLALNKVKISTHFARVTEIIQEASYWAGYEEQEVVKATAVDRAIKERQYRDSKIQEQMRERILDGTINVETQGHIIGQVNGLSVLEIADYEFGLPSRISAQTYMGKGSVVAIDREANLAGNLHNKGLLILQGYLGAKFSQKKPTGLSASLTFEQNYDRIEGDSASSAELYVLLSSLSHKPIRQDLAVTGSIDQQGHLQSIGAINAKIEGFFDICKARGLTGTQGAVIPEDNIRNLILRDDVVQAVREERFHVHVIQTVDQGIEILTGLPAGEADDQGFYPEGTINSLVQARLLEMAGDKPQDSQDIDDLQMPTEAVDKEIPPVRDEE